MQVAKDQDTVVLQRLEDGSTETVVGGQALRVQTEDLRADRCCQLADGEQTHWPVLPDTGLVPGSARGTGQPVRTMTASAASTGAGCPMISTAIATITRE